MTRRWSRNRALLSLIAALLCANGCVNYWHERDLEADKLSLNRASGRWAVARDEQGNCAAIWDLTLTFEPRDALFVAGNEYMADAQPYRLLNFRHPSEMTYEAVEDRAGGFTVSFVLGIVTFGLGQWYYNYWYFLRDDELEFHEGMLAEALRASPDAERDFRLSDAEAAKARDIVGDGLSQRKIDGNLDKCAPKLPEMVRYQLEEPNEEFENLLRRAVKEPIWFDWDMEGLRRTAAWLLRNQPESDRDISDDLAATAGLSGRPQSESLRSILRTHLAMKRILENDKLRWWARPIRKGRPFYVLSAGFDKVDRLPIAVLDFRKEDPRWLIMLYPPAQRRDPKYSELDSLGATTAASIGMTTLGFVSVEMELLGLALNVYAAADIEHSAPFRGPEEDVEHKGHLAYVLESSPDSAIDQGLTAAESLRVLTTARLRANRYALDLPEIEPVADATWERLIKRSDKWTADEPSAP